MSLRHRVEEAGHLQGDREFSAGSGRADGDRTCPQCRSTCPRRMPRSPAYPGGPPCRVGNGPGRGCADAYAEARDLRNRTRSNSESGGPAGPPATRRRGPHSDCEGPCRVRRHLSAAVRRAASHPAQASAVLTCRYISGVITVVAPLGGPGDGCGGSGCQSRRSRRRQRCSAHRTDRCVRPGPRRPRRRAGPRSARDR